ncbi:MAG: acetylxylan esterase, partial [Acidobacteriota bacterium]
MFAVVVLMIQLALSTASSQNPGFNYDEAKVGAYTLPDPLMMTDGKRVANQRQWRQRRSEILRLFETNEYGRTPKSAKNAGSISFAETSRDPKALGGLATRKEVTVFLTGKKDGAPKDVLKMSVLFFVPNNRKQPAPVFLGLNFNGNQAVSNDPGIALATAWLRDAKDTGAVNNRATEKSRGTESSRWAIEMIVKRGYAVATIYCGDLFPDHKDGLADSVIPHFYRKGQTGPDVDEWNALGAWAWGLSRAVDY